MNEPITLHKYLYAHANPVKYTDPSGYNATYADMAGAVALTGILVGGVTIGTGLLIKMHNSMLEDLESIKDSLGVWIRYYIHQAATKNPEDVSTGSKVVGNEIDEDAERARREGKPRRKHMEESGKKKLPSESETNSSADLLNPDGTVKQRRYY